MSYTPDWVKIDRKAVDGMTIPPGEVGSLGYLSAVIQNHIHTPTYCMGSDGAGSAAIDSFTPYVVTAGSPAQSFGTEVQIYDGSPIPGFGTKGDLNRVFIRNTSAVNVAYILQFWYGPTTFAAAQLMTSFYHIAAAAQLREGASEVSAPRIAVGSDKVWARCACETAGATISFMLETHGYPG